MEEAASGADCSGDSLRDTRTSYARSEGWEPRSSQKAAKQRDDMLHEKIAEMLAGAYERELQRVMVAAEARRARAEAEHEEEMKRLRERIRVMEERVAVHEMAMETRTAGRELQDSASFESNGDLRLEGETGGHGSIASAKETQVAKEKTGPYSEVKQQQQMASASYQDEVPESLVVSSASSGPEGGPLAGAEENELAADLGSDAASTACFNDDGVERVREAHASRAVDDASEAGGSNGPSGCNAAVKTMSFGSKDEDSLSGASFEESCSGKVAEEEGVQSESESSADSLNAEKAAQVTGEAAGERAAGAGAVLREAEPADAGTGLSGCENSAALSVTQSSSRISPISPQQSQVLAKLGASLRQQQQCLAAVLDAAKSHAVLLQAQIERKDAQLAALGREEKVLRERLRQQEEENDARRAEMERQRKRHERETAERSRTLRRLHLEAQSWRQRAEGAGEFHRQMVRAMQMAAAHPTLRRVQAMERQLAEKDAVIGRLSTGLEEALRVMRAEMRRKERVILALAEQLLGKGVDGCESGEMGRQAAGTAEVDAKGVVEMLRIEMDKSGRLKNKVNKTKVALAKIVVMAEGKKQDLPS